jgi:hypothetical protein
MMKKTMLLMASLVLALAPLFGGGQPGGGGGGGKKRLSGNPESRNGRNFLPHEDRCDPDLLDGDKLESVA